MLRGSSAAADGRGRARQPRPPSVGARDDLHRAGLERTGRFDSATQTYIRITQDFNATRNAQGQELEGADLRATINILDESNFRAGQNLERVFNWGGTRFATTATSRVISASPAPRGAPRASTTPSRPWPSSPPTSVRGTQAADAWRNFIPVATAAVTAPRRSTARRSSPSAPRLVRGDPLAAGLLRRSPTSADNAQFRVQAQYSSRCRTSASATPTPTAARCARWSAWCSARRASSPARPPRRGRRGALPRPRRPGHHLHPHDLHPRQRREPHPQQLGRLKTQLTAIDQAATAVVQLAAASTPSGPSPPGRGPRPGHAGAADPQPHRPLDQRQRAARRHGRGRHGAGRAGRRPARAGRRQPRRGPEPARSRAAAPRPDRPAAPGDDRQVRQRFDEEAEAERKLAIVDYGLAVYTARNNNIPTPFAARALERLRATTRPSRRPPSVSRTSPSRTARGCSTARPRAR